MMPSLPAKFGAFGGHWSDKKLLVVQTYFASFNQALSKTTFTRVYIDAFAGGGRVKHKATNKKQIDAVEDCNWFAADFSDADGIPTGEGLDGPESESLRHGSPLLALEADPCFEEFIFIERDPATMAELKDQVNNSPSLRGRPVDFICEDANVALARICQPGWSRTRRATIFLDPFALQIRWSTLEAIARTKGMDMWMLFPAMAVNRMLPRNADVPEYWASRLTETFGDSSWRQEFYAVHEAPMEGELFPELVPAGKEIKLSDPFGRLSRYVTRRLKTIFAGAIEQPLVLKTESGSPLFLLCFAVANERGAPIAKRIADHIIKKH